MKLLAVVALVAAVVTYIGTKSTLKIFEDSMLEHQRVLIKEVAKNADLWLYQKKEVMNALLHQLEEGGAGKWDVSRMLRMTMNAGQFTDVYIGYADNGKLEDGAGWTPPHGYDARLRPWYEAALNAGRMVYTRPYIDMTTHKPVIALAAPLQGPGRLTGVLSADINLDTLAWNILQLKVGRSGHAFIIASDGLILAHKNKSLQMQRYIQFQDPSLSGLIREIEHNESGTYSYGDVNSPQLLSYQRLSSTDWYICTSMPEHEAQDLARRKTLLYAVGFIFSLLGLLALLIFVTAGGSAIFFVKMNRSYLSEISTLEERYHTLFDVANDAIIVLDGNVIAEVNEKAATVFALEGDALTGKGILEISAPVQANGELSHDIIEKYLKNTSDGAKRFFEWRFVRPDGTVFPAEVSMTTLHLQGEAVSLAVIRDISERIAAMEQLRHTQKMAAMGEMLAAIAHQWRQPLNTLSTYIASLPSAERNGKLNAEFIASMVSASDQQIQFMSKTIDDFRNFFKPTKNKELFNLISAVESALKLSESQVKHLGIDILREYSAGAKQVTVCGYRSEFLHVVLNLMTNAADAIIEAENGREKVICVGADIEGDTVVLTVEDSGTGIPQHMMDEIFKPYVTTKGTAFGTGMGLYMAKMIIEKEMKGSLTAENHSGGARFVIRLHRNDVEGTC